MSRPPDPVLVRSGEELRAWRGRLGLSQRAAAAAVGVSARCIGAYERGEWQLPVVFAWALVGVEGHVVRRDRYILRRARRQLRRQEHTRAQGRASQEV